MICRVPQPTAGCRYKQGTSEFNLRFLPVILICIANKTTGKTGFAPRQQPGRQDRADQFVLRQPLGIRSGLQILVGHVQIAVTKEVADGELVFTQFQNVATSLGRSF